MKVTGLSVIVPLLSLRPMVIELKPFFKAARSVAVKVNEPAILESALIISILREAVIGCSSNVPLLLIELPATKSISSAVKVVSPPTVIMPLPVNVPVFAVRAKLPPTVEVVNCNPVVFASVAFAPLPVVLSSIAPETFN